ncbi:biopolymer transporter ExbD [Undibacterium sp.]|jgi:biopolymer transport protein ExbD|uniref:ExbD/TolR family protein n=1 Tax=Undibacterium sp. TaxID=1914977 RepID=UPI002C64FFCA|nr:biopolymer transporter ExbD [Undibacterium sp.]HTD03728.1 biopolymer transporter ExbD [Undibacterium sp.]
MGMNVRSGSSSAEPDVMIEMNMTPLIDVMLVLIIMLIITIPIQNHAVNLNMPTSSPAKPLQEPVVITIDVDFDGTVLWNGFAVAGRDELESKLREVAAQSDQPEVHLKPNKLVAYKSVAAVMASAQRLGVTKIGMIGNEQFIND